MSRSIAKRPRHAILKTTAVCLRVVLHQQKAMTAAGFRNLVRIGTAAEQVDYHHRTGTRSDVALYQVAVDLQRTRVGFHKNGHQSVGCQRQYGSNVGVGRHDDFVARREPSHLDISFVYQGERIKPVSHPHTMFGMDIVGVGTLKASQFVTQQVPP